MQPTLSFLVNIIFLLLCLHRASADVIPPPPTRTTDNPKDLELRKRVAQAAIPSCTWEGHCLGDPCSQDGDCDHGWVCVKSICALDSGGDTVLPTATGPGHTVAPTTVPTTTVVSVVTTVKSVAVSHTPTATGSAGGVTKISASGTATATSSATTSAASSSHGGLKTGAIIGIGAGAGGAGLFAIVLLSWMLLRRRRNQQNAQRASEYVNPHATEYMDPQVRTDYYNEPYKYQMVANPGQGGGNMGMAGQIHTQPEAAELAGDGRSFAAVELPTKIAR